MRLARSLIFDKAMIENNQGQAGIVSSTGAPYKKTGAKQVRAGLIKSFPLEAIRLADPSVFQEA